MVARAGIFELTGKKKEVFCVTQFACTGQGFGVRGSRHSCRERLPNSSLCMDSRSGFVEKIGDVSCFSLVVQFSAMFEVCNIHSAHPTRPEMLLEMMETRTTNPEAETVTPLPAPVPQPQPIRLRFAGIASCNLSS